MSTKEICNRCGQPKSADKPGSITQWVSVCQCDLALPFELSVSTDICSICGFRIQTGNAGSLTQWIFRSEICQCEFPEPTPRADIPKQQNLIKEKGEEFDFDPQEFPIHRYKPLSQLGSGGAGVVFLALDKHLNKNVAVKVLFKTTEEELIYFQREAQIIAKLNHQNIIKIIDFGVTEGNNPYMVLDYINGLNLEQLLKMKGLPDDFTAMEMIFQIADALSHGHRLGIFHRDIKTANILVTMTQSEEPKVQIIDFGVAAFISGEDSATIQGRTLVGTPKYMPPDLVLGKVYDARSEIYSLGCLMYEILCGVPPFEGDDPLELISKHTTEEPKPLNNNCPEEFKRPDKLEKIVMTCLAKEPDNRYQSMDNLISTLTKFAESDQDLAASVKTIAGHVIAERFEPDENSVPFYLLAGLAFVSIVSIVVLVFFQGTEYNTEVKSKRSDSSLEETHSLEELDFSRDDEKLYTIEPATNGLKKLKSRSKILTDSEIKKLDKKENISIIDLKNSQVTGTGFSGLNSTVVNWVKLDNCPISDQGMKEIGKFKNVNCLMFSGCRNFTDDGVSHLKGLPIARLDLDFSSVSDKSMEHVAKLKKLNCLSLNYTPLVTASGIRSLKNLPALKILRITVDDNKEEDYFNAIRELNLKALVIYGIQYEIPSRNIELLTGMEYVDLTGILLNKDCILALGRNKKLQTLDLDSNGIGDNLIPQLIKLPVSSLGLYRQNITNTGFADLSKMKNLKLLSLKGNQYVSPFALEKLKKLRPDLKIVENKRYHLTIPNYSPLKNLK